MSCTVCSEEYVNTDEIYSTDCGHIYHFNCLDTWLKRTPKCPMCNAENPKIHKIHLDIEERNTADLEIAQSELTSINQDKIKLQQDLAEVDDNLMKLQIQFSETEKQSHDKMYYLTLQIEGREKENIKLKSEKKILLEKIECLLEKNETLTANIESLTERNNQLILDKKQQRKEIENLDRDCKKYEDLLYKTVVRD